MGGGKGGGMNLHFVLKWEKDGASFSRYNKEAFLFYRQIVAGEGERGKRVDVPGRIEMAWREKKGSIMGARRRQVAATLPSPRKKKRGNSRGSHTSAKGERRRTMLSLWIVFWQHDRYPPLPKEIRASFISSLAEGIMVGGHHRQRHRRGGRPFHCAAGKRGGRAAALSSCPVKSQVTR